MAEKKPTRRHSGKPLRILRQHLDLSIAEVARESKRDQGFLSRVEVDAVVITEELYDTLRAAIVRAAQKRQKRLQQALDRAVAQEA